MDAGLSKLCDFVAGVLGVERDLIGAETGPGHLPKWDSLGHIQLVAALEEQYGVQFSTDEILTLLSVTDVAGALREKGVTLE